MGQATAATRDEQWTQRMAALDVWSRQRLTGIGVPADARCLDVGAGRGTMAYWLAEQVTRGRVTATDVRELGVPSHPRLTFRRHDVRHDPLGGPYDLIYVRAVLTEMRGRDDVLRKLADALAPGGVLVVEEYHLYSYGVVDAPDAAKAAKILDLHREVMTRIMRRDRIDPQWCWQVPRLMHQSGLVDAKAEVGGARTFRGGDAESLGTLERAERARAKVLSAPASVSPAGRVASALAAPARRSVAAQLGRVVELLADPDVLVMGDVRVVTSGRKPAG